MSIWRQTGREPAMLADAPRLPDGCGHVWNDFIDLSQCRAVVSGPAGASPAGISFADLHAWQAVTGTRLEAWELAAIRKIDTAYLANFAARANVS